MTEEKLKLVQPILDTFENEDIKEFAMVLLEDLPEYIWHVGASSTGKYHPAYSLGEGGLIRHQIAVVRFLNFFFELEQYNSKLTTREMDLVRLAGLVHDGRKSGSQEEYERSKYTKFNHPLLMADVVRSYDGQYLISEEIELIADAISKHMGEWNTDKKSSVVLPKPNNKYARMVHTADYLASRKVLTMDFEGYDAPKPVLPDINTWTFTFGKYSGKTIPEINEIAPDYLLWARDNMNREPARSLIKEFLKPKKEQ